MARLRGRGLGMGMALGTAAVVRVSRGIPLSPEPPERIAQQIALGKLAEKPDVIVVAADYNVALAVAEALTWARVVGVASESAPHEVVVPEFPAVTEVVGLLDATKNDGLLLIDAERNLVLADPDGLDIAAYQQERTGLSPRKRIYLDEAHAPAQTLEGRMVQAVAIVATQDEVTRALEEGADALYIPLNSSLLPTNANENELRRRLFWLLDMTAGKPLFLSDDYAFPLLTLLEAATRADVTLAVPPRNDLEGLGMVEIRHELDAVLNECFENDTPCALPRLAIDLTHLEPFELYNAGWIERVVAGGATRMVISMETSNSELTLTTLAMLNEAFAAASENLLPVYMTEAPLGLQDETPETTLPIVIGAGVTGVLTYRVAYVKGRVRDLSFAECQQAYFQWGASG